MNKTFQLVIYYLNHTSHPPRSRTPQSKPESNISLRLLIGFPTDGSSSIANTDELKRNFLNSQFLCS